LKRKEDEDDVDDSCSSASDGGSSRSPIDGYEEDEGIIKL
jgi:hypothetical protein